jgi:hypothetical protein
MQCRVSWEGYYEWKLKELQEPVVAGLQIQINERQAKTKVIEPCRFDFRDYDPL